MTPKQVAICIAETMAETRQPMVEGKMYAVLMGRISLDTFQQACNALVDSGLVTRQGHVLTGTETLYGLMSKA